VDGVLNQPGFETGTEKGLNQQAKPEKMNGAKVKACTSNKGDVVAFRIANHKGVSIHLKISPEAN